MPDKLFIRIWDVSHGSAAYVRTPAGRHMAIDLGVGDTSGNESGDPEKFSPLKALREQHGIQQLDRVVITHPHTDHLDDILEFEKLSPKTLLFAKHLKDEEVMGDNPRQDKAILNKYLEITRRFTKPLTGGSIEDERPNFDFRSFHPRGCATSNLNNQSIVVFLTYAGSTICIPGDPEGPAWRELLQVPDFTEYLAKTDILVASHHGRDSGYCEDIFEHIKSPRLKLVIISDGPQMGTCVAGQYGRKAGGWLVNSYTKQGQTTRNCLTTRKDGFIDITFSSGFITVTTEK